MMKMIIRLKKYYKKLVIPIIVYFIMKNIIAYYGVFVSTKVGDIINSWTGKVPNIKILLYSGVIIGLLYIFQAIITYISGCMGEMLYKRAAQNMKNDAFNHIMRLPISYFDTTTTGATLEKAFSTIRNLTPTLFAIPTEITSALVALIATIIAMMKINYSFAITIFCVAPFSLILLHTVYQQLKTVI